MSHFADYMNERFGHETIEFDSGFVSYSMKTPFCCIEDFYIHPERRRAGEIMKYMNAVLHIAKGNSEITHLWSQVWANAQNATQSLRAALAYGFQVQNAEGGRIILTKEIGGE